MKNTTCRGRRPRRPAKRIISLILSFIMLSSITAGLDFSAFALASSGSCGTNVTWSFVSSTGTLTISGTGKMTDWSSTSDCPFANQTAIKKVVIKSGVTSIGRDAFYKCTSLTSVTIPDSVTSIGDYAFSDCTGLTSITIPDCVTSIGNYAFYKCTGLTSVTIPDCVTSIGNYAFYNCTGLTSVTIGNSVRSVNSFAFACCTGLTSVTIGNSVTSIDSYAFSGCTDLPCVTIPNGVYLISDGAFSSTGLISVTIPNSVTSIYRYAFDCPKLKNIYFTGTESEWDYISQGTDAVISSATVYYCFQQNNENEPCITHVWNIGTTTSRPTCVKTGVKKFTCTSCGATRTETIPAKDHSYNSGTITTQATCTKTGVKKYTCTVCGATKTETIPATGVHTYGSGTITTQPTCGTSGVKTYTCSVCGNKKTETVPATGVHTYDNGTITTQATCTKTGVKIYTCTICGATKTETVPATGVHTYDSGTITTQPTCTKTGVKKYKCINCTNSYTETVPALGHNYTERVTKAATCTESGVKTFTCSRCNNSYTATVNALGHNYKTTIKKATPKEDGYSDSVCTRCGDEHYKCIESPEVSITQYVYDYDGKTKKPEVLVYKNGEYNSYLSKENYSIVYPKESKKLGTYTIKIVLKGAYYSGTFEESFKIQPKSVNPKKIKTKPYSKEQISVSWKKVKGVDGYIVYRWSNKKGKYVKYKKTKKTSIKIKRENKKTNQVDFVIATYKKQGKKNYEGYWIGKTEWVKLSAPTFKIEQNEIKEFTMVFPYKDFYYIQWSNNANFSVDDKNTSKNYWVKTGMYADKNNDPAKKVSRIRVFGLKANQTVYVRARKVYYNKKGKLVLGPWSKAKKVITY